MVTDPVLRYVSAIRWNGLFLLRSQLGGVAVQARCLACIELTMPPPKMFAIAVRLLAVSQQP
jgi:hypothetical protein